VFPTSETNRVTLLEFADLEEKCEEM
jgi:hypothetical protein